ncbi:MAG: hypothetical protein K6E16_08930 [Lachnospiraceae bacterium]|nr:hypothetical protein [Lachnospiraceae bacterium]
MRSIEEQIAEISRKKSYYTERKRIRNLSFLAAGMAAVLVAALLFVPNITGTVGTGNTLLGSMILGSETGGYIIVALLAFSLGITITIITQRSSNNHKDRDPQNR